MSRIHKSAVALAASMALGGGMMAGAAPAEAACTTGVYCSMSYAKQVSASAAKYGAKNSSVRNLQASLRAVGWDLPVTGTFSSQTKRALGSYQASRKLTATGTVNASTLHALRVGAGRKYAPITSAKVTSSVAVTAASSSRAQRAVNYAYGKLGRPYRYGATGPNSFDCSGLTQAAWRSAGVSLPRTSYAQYSALRKVSVRNLRPGDVVSFYGGGHVGIYVGNGYVIHAPNSRSVVKKVKMNTMPVRGAVRPA